MKHHFLHYMDHVIQNRWNDVAFADYGENKQYTHGEVAQQIERFHKLFHQMGINEGDKIAIASRNCSNWVVSYMAILSYKAVAVTLLQDFKADDLARLIKHSDAKMLFVGPFVWRELQHQELPALEAIISMDDFSFIHLDESHKGRVEHIMQEESALTENTFFSLVKDGVINLDSMALINYTSGSTGSPKGVMISHRSLSNNVENGQYILPVEPGQRVVSMLPLAHMFGQLADFLYPFSAGATIYYLTKTPTPSILLKAMADVKPYLVATVPLVIEKIYKKKLDPLLSKAVLKICWHTPLVMNFIRNHVRKSLIKAFGGQVRYFLCGGAAMNPVVEKCLMDVNFPLSIGFGMTECGPLVSGMPPKYFKRRSCGAPVPGMEAMIDNPNEKGEGEILVRGENVMMGYYKNEEATNAVIDKDGWLHTGDMGIMDPDGTIYIKGRCKTMILTGTGQNIYPEEIEDKLNNLPMVLELLIIESKGVLKALIVPDYDSAAKENIGEQELHKMMEDNIKTLNTMVASYERVAHLEILKSEFEKTPKRSIKRFLYQDK
jgi:long-chain acyl-CoA synthetase